MDKSNIFKIGIGTWKINPENFNNEIEGLKYSFDKGQNYLSLSMLYNNGEVVRKIKSFIDLVGRKNLFISAYLEKYIEKIEDVEKQLNEYLRVLNIDYVECLQIHIFTVCKIPIIDVYKEIERLVKNGKVKYIGISNVSLEQLKEINKSVKIDFFEGIYNLDCKYYENTGLINYCNENNIDFLAYQPLRRNRIVAKDYKFLKRLSKKYNKTQNQIMINWIVKEKGIYPLIKSTNVNRIKENVESLDFDMDTDDYDILNKFQNEKINSIEINWEDESGITIDQLANQDESKL